MAKSLTKQQVVDGIRDGLLTRLESGQSTECESVVKLMDTLSFAHKLPGGYYDAYIAGGVDAIETIRAIVDELFAEDKTPAVDVSEPTDS